MITTADVIKGTRLGLGATGAGRILALRAGVSLDRIESLMASCEFLTCILTTTISMCVASVSPDLSYEDEVVFSAIDVRDVGRLRMCWSCAAMRRIFRDREMRDSYANVPQPLNCITRFRTSLHSFRNICT